LGYLEWITGKIVAGIDWTVNLKSEMQGYSKLIAELHDLEPLTLAKKYILRD